jgi:hypothetical protein
MNIFALDDNPRVAAQQHLDKHIVKMLIEYAQLLSTAHRLLDGQTHELEYPNGKKQKLHTLHGERFSLATKTVSGDSLKPGRLKSHPYKYVIENPVCYNASHQNHPCAVWTRESDSNYNWLFKLFEECAREYQHRYGKQHKTYREQASFLSLPPRNIAAGDRTDFPQAMDDKFKVKDDSITAYRNYYLGPKAAFARWTNRSAPYWFKAGTKDYDVSHFERTRQLA